MLSMNICHEIYIFLLQTMRQYTNVISRSTVSPHIFAIADAAFSSLCLDNYNQCCIVSGESGAGEICISTGQIIELV